jgi:hypothetical protein
MKFYDVSLVVSNNLAWRIFVNALKRIYYRATLHFHNWVEITSQRFIDFYMRKF